MCVPPIPQATIYLKNCFSLCIDDRPSSKPPFLKGALRLSASHLANLCNGMCPRGCNAIQLDTRSIGEGALLIVEMKKIKRHGDLIAQRNITRHSPDELWNGAKKSPAP